MDSEQPLVQHSSWDLEPHKIEREQIDPDYKKKLRKQKKGTTINVNGVDLTVCGGDLNNFVNGNVIMGNIDDFSNSVSIASQWNMEIPDPTIHKSPHYFTHRCMECNVFTDFHNTLCDKCSKERIEELFLENEDARHSQLIIDEDDNDKV